MNDRSRPGAAHGAAAEKDTARFGPSRNPFDRPLDRILLGLRLLAHEYELAEPPYRLHPGTGDEPDSWLAVCPVHPSSGPTLLIVDRGEDAEPTLRCRVGCPPPSIHRILVPDPEREAHAVAMSRVLLWAQRYSRERRAAA